MAYQEQTFTNLGNPMNPDPSQALGGGFLADIPIVPFSINDKTNEMLITTIQDSIKIEAQKKNEYEKKLTEKISVLSKQEDGILPQDYEIISNKQKELIKEYYNDPSILLGKNPQKQIELDQKFVDLTATIQKAKATKKVSDTFFETMKKDSDYGNKVNQSIYERYINTPLNERNEVVVPMYNNENDFITKELPQWYKVKGEEENTSSPVEGDKFSTQFDFNKKYKYDEFLEFFKSRRGRYLKAEWDIDKDLQEMYDGNFDQYIDDKAKSYFEEKVPYKQSIVRVNEEMKQEELTKRLEEQIQSRERISSNNNEVKERIAELKNNAKIDNFPLVETMQKKWDIFDNAVIGREKVVVDDKGNYMMFDKLSQAPKEIADWIYNGDKSDPEYGVFFRGIDKNGEKVYFPAKAEYYTKSGSQTTKNDMYLKPDLSKTKVVPNRNKPLSEEQLFSSMFTDQKGKIEYSEYLKTKQELDKLENEYNTLNRDNTTTKNINGSSIIGINELAYNPMGRGYDNGILKDGMKWKGHDTHIHIGFTDPNVALSIIDKAQKLGLNVGQNPYIGKVDKVHTDKSFHYDNFNGFYNGKKLGKGADITGDSKKLKELFEWIESSYKNNTKQFKTKKGKVINFTVEN